MGIGVQVLFTVLEGCSLRELSDKTGKFHAEDQRQQRSEKPREMLIVQKLLLPLGNIRKELFSAVVSCSATQYCLATGHTAASRGICGCHKAHLLHVIR